MQQLMRLFRTGLAEILGIQRFNGFVMMRKPVFGIQILIKQTFGALFANIVGNAARFRLVRHHDPGLSAAGNRLRH